MSTNANKRGASVKVNEHSTFALQLAAYLKQLLKERKMSGRALAREAATNGHAHWADIIAGVKVMTTNDIKVASDVFAMSPYEFVANARKHSEKSPDNVTPMRRVGGVTEDDYEQASTDQQALPEKRVAKRGRLKADQAEGDEGTSEDGGGSGA